jgi:putative flippase GtrA
VTAFTRFTIVGAIGFAVQAASLILLARAGMPLAVATIAAVEVALLHNFMWHERWTWAGSGAGTTVSRLARFHAANGTVSLLGNALITPGLAQAGVPLVAASLAAVLACAVMNFTAAHLWVFCAKTWPTLHGHLP